MCPEQSIYGNRIKFFMGSKCVLNSYLKNSEIIKNWSRI